MGGPESASRGAAPGADHTISFTSSLILRDQLLYLDLPTVITQGAARRVLRRMLRHRLSLRNIVNTYRVHPRPVTQSRECLGRIQENQARIILLSVRSRPS